MPDLQPKTHQEELDILQKLGFPVNPYNQSLDSLEKIWQLRQKLTTQKDSLNYPVDGLVVKLNDNELTEKLGIIGKTPRSWCAIKFESTEVATKILGVSWQLGRTGKITPVAELEPVLLAGTTVKRATLHNYKEFLEKDLHQKDTLVIHKAGEIIPEVVKILENLRLPESSKFDSPKNCPSCQTELQISRTDVDLFCPNTQNCPEQILLRLSYFCQRNIANLTGLSQKTIEKFIKEFGVQDIYDLYKLPYSKIAKMEGFGQKSVENLQDSVEKAKKLRDYKFLAGLGLEGLGPEVAKLICQKLLQKSEFQNDSIKKSVENQEKTEFNNLNLENT